VGGAEKVFTADANLLHRQGFKVFFIIIYGDQYNNPLLKDLDIGQENIFFIHAKSILDYTAYIKIIKIIKNIDPGMGIVYSTLDDSNFFSRIISIFLPNIQLVTREANTTEFKSLSHKFADILINWRVNTIVAVSEEVKKSIISYQPWCASKIKVLHNGVIIPEEIASCESQIILTVGSLTEKKNHLMLLEAFHHVVMDFPESKLVIVGDGVNRSKLQKYAIEKGIDARVTFLGKLDHERVKNEYLNCGIFALSSDQEGSPNVLLEAMSYGIPVVATRTGSVPEIIESGVSGFVTARRESLAFAEYLKKLLGSLKLRKEIGSRGRQEIINRFSGAIHIAELKKIFDL
jgi:glycosyltransferase involved in cell wall biosynthesis